jgi:hypothetical protein
MANLLSLLNSRSRIVLFKNQLIPKTTMYATWDKLYLLCEPLMLDHQSDLDIDRQLVIAAQSPFIHWTRQSGTCVEPMIAPDQYPKRGERVPYLFGTADREHILNQRIGTATYWTNKNNLPVEACHYFDGKTLKRITLETAVALMRDYGMQVRNCWENPRLFDRLDKTPETFSLTA